MESWKVGAETEKRSLLGRSVSPRCVYTDPLTQAKGHDELVAYMLQFHRQIPGGHFVTEYFLAHHDRGIAKWTMRAADGSVLGDGISYGEYDAEGRLVAMTGFFEPPAGAG